ncbi:pentapeptide repeat-containing protein [Streptomyces sp. NPDC006393]|uniref:pentapeptide repeat-containing protein n=1 Tax=Streptomyces sp. NPDC006393 TaxID=3156763 RepID=UPI003406CEB4
MAALGFTAVTIHQAGEEQKLTRDEQVTNRYNAAVTNLGDNSEEVRLGGLYALERIAKDSPRDAPTVVQVISAYVRSHAVLSKNAPEPPAHPASDVAAALAILVTPLAKDTPIDLNGAELSGANLRGADLHGANLVETDLNGADLSQANLSGANLDASGSNGADFHGADLHGAKVSANLSGSNLRNVNLSNADLTLADLELADLTHADLSHAILKNANVKGATLEYATLKGADLEGANLKASEGASPKR